MTDKWELYHQTGPDGQEWGVKIRPGYTVTGFAREDAEAVVAWQNASCRPASDILERAKAEYEIADDDIVDLLGELIADVEAHRARDLILCAIIKEREAEKERLEAAFLEAEERVLWDEVVVEGPKEGRAKRHIAIVQRRAREALEKIRSGEKDE